MAETSTQKINWTLLLESIKNALKDKEFDKSEVCRLLSSYESQEKDWTQYVFFGENRYTRNLVDVGNGNYNLIIMAWNPSQRTSIHNHSNSSCYVKILSGALREIRYETPEHGKEFKEIDDHLRKRDEVTYIEDSMGVHEMKNDTANQTVSLHLYVPPFDICYCYDPVTAQATPSPLTFTSVFGVVHEADNKLGLRQVDNTC